MAYGTWSRAALVVAAWAGMAQAAEPVKVGDVALAATGQNGAYTGFEVTVKASPVATVLLQAGSRWTARTATDFSEGKRKGIELRGLDTAGSGGTPSLGATSSVRISLAPGERYPRVDFRLDVAAFDPARWEAAIGQKAPLHFLALPMPNARVWYLHGLLCPTPKWDPYPMTRASIHGLWADGWSFGPALGALTVPAMALWDDQSANMVGYEWAEARFTDKTDKDLGIAFCSGAPGCDGQFLTLLSNSQRHWNELTYPQAPLALQSHLRILYASDLPANADVNELVLRHIFADYAPVLPQVPAMNDLSWMVDRRLDELGEYGPRGGGFLGTVNLKNWGFDTFFFEDGTVVYGGSYRDTDQMFKKGDAKALAAFDADLARFLTHAQWQEIGGDRCCFWRYPLEKGWNAASGGEAADTTHNVQQFGVGAAILAAYANTGRADLLPYIDGLFNYVRHYVYTRGDICDIPESMFTLQASALATDFLMNYRTLFQSAGDAEHRKRADEAFELANTVLYRNANATLGDSDERDTVSGNFLMPGNYAKYWLGMVSAAELSLPVRSMIQLYAETGDPVYKWLVRGALERWWICFKEDCWHTAENVDIWGESEGRKGAHSGIHGPCDDFWEWALPVGDARLRVTVGAKGALAFCKGTRALDVGDYAYAAPKGFRFRVTESKEEAEPFAIIVSSPWRDLSGLRVAVDGREVAGADLRVLGTYKEHLYIRGVKAGSMVEIGDASRAQQVKAAAVPVVGGVADVPKAALTLGERTFKIVDLGAKATVKRGARWSSPDELGGLPAGLSFANGVPYWVAPQEVGPGGKVSLEGREAFIFAEAAQPGALTLETGGRTLDLAEGPKLLAAEGWPMCAWKLWIYPVKLEGGKGKVRVAPSGKLLGATLLQSGPGLVEELQRQAAAAAAAKQSGDSPALAEAAKRLAASGAAKGRPVAFIQPCGNTYAELAECAEKLGLEAYTLTPQNLVDEQVFSAERFPVAIYTGIEDYYRTVKRPGDGEAALLRYLRQGGTLIVAGECHPFSYPIDVQADGTEKRSKECTGFNRNLELFIQDPGQSAADAIGFEMPPAGVSLTLKLSAGQQVLSDFPKERPYPTTGDVRYRPASGIGLAAGDRFEPIVTTEGADGRHYGAAAALIEYGGEALKGGRALLAWGSLLKGDLNKGSELSAQLLTWAVENAHPATAAIPEALSQKLTPGGCRVAVLPPNTAGREAIIRAACQTAGAEPVFLSAVQTVSHAFFNAKNFPIAIQAADGEQWLCSYLAPGDGEQAYKRYLREGGTLIVCQPSTPFFFELYFEAGQWKTRPPHRFWSMAYDLGFETEQGFEKPDATMHLELTDSGRKLWPDLPQGLALDNLRDTRWRPLVGFPSTAARRFTPLAYATQPDGSRYPGLAAAQVEFLDSEYGGARLIVLWGGMVEGATGQKMLEGALRQAKTPAEGTQRRY